MTVSVTYIALLLLLLPQGVPLLLGTCACLFKQGLGRLFVGHKALDAHAATYACGRKCCHLQQL